MKKKKSIIKISVFILIGIIILYNLCWALNYTLTYTKYQKRVGFDALSKSYGMIKDGYQFYLCTPRYPEFTGNLDASKIMTGLEENKPENSCRITIWPSLLGEPKMAVTIEKYETKSVNGHPSCNEDSLLTCYMDKNLNLKGKYTSEQEAIFKENFALVQETWQRTKDAFEIK